MSSYIREKADLRDREAQIPAKRAWANEQGLTASESELRQIVYSAWLWLSRLETDKGEKPTGLDELERAFEVGGLDKEPERV